MSDGEKKRFPQNTAKTLILPKIRLEANIGKKEAKLPVLCPRISTEKRAWNPGQHLYTLLGIDSTEELLTDTNINKESVQNPAEEAWGSEHHEQVLLSTKSTVDLKIHETTDEHVKIKGKELSGSEQLLHTLLGSRSAEDLPRTGQDGTIEGMTVSGDHMEDNMSKGSTPEQSALNVLITNNTDTLSQSPDTNFDEETKRKEVWGCEEYTPAFLGADVTDRLSASLDITVDEGTNWKEVWNHEEYAPILLDTDSLDKLFEGAEFNIDKEWDPEQWTPTLLGTGSTEKLLSSLDMSLDEEKTMRKEVWDPGHRTPPFSSICSVEDIFQSSDFSADEETKREEIWCSDNDSTTLLDTDRVIRMSKSPGICNDEETRGTEAVESEAVGCKEVFPYVLGYEVAQELSTILVRNADGQQTEAARSTRQPGSTEETPVEGSHQFLSTLRRFDINIGDTKREVPEDLTENLGREDDLPLSWGECAGALLIDNVAKEWRNRSRSMRRTMMRVKRKKMSEKTHTRPLEVEEEMLEDIQKDEKEPAVGTEDRAQLRPEASKPEEEAVALVSQGDQVLEEEEPTVTSASLNRPRSTNFFNSIRTLLRRISVRDWLANRGICWPHGGTRRVSPM
ncbi:uncharacterized protein [Pleurodeles waltl]